MTTTTNNTILESNQKVQAKKRKLKTGPNSTDKTGLFKTTKENPTKKVENRLRHTSNLMHRRQ